MTDDLHGQCFSQMPSASKVIEVHLALHQNMQKQQVWTVEPKPVVVAFLKPAARTLLHFRP